MADITITYNDNNIATMNASGTKTLQTKDKVCVDDIQVAYIKPSGGSVDVEALSVSANGTYTAPTGKAYSPVTVAVKDDTILNALIGRSITEIESNITNIGSSAFRNCANLATVYFPQATQIGIEAFYNTAIPEITKTNFPVANSCSTNAFSRITALQRVFLPDTSLGQACFANCTNLIHAVIEKTTNTMCFNGCSKLADVDIATGKIPAQTFTNCGVLNTIVLRNTSLSTLDNQNAFNGTPFASGGSGGTIYIPKSLYDQLGTGTTSDYKAATNWSVINGYGTITWAKIEGSAYENTYADGTPIN